MDIVLLGADLEVMESKGDGAGATLDVDRVFHPVSARMADPLAAGHELPFHILAEGIAHAAVTAGQTHAVHAHRAHHALALFPGNGAHGPHRHDEIQILQLIIVQNRVQGIGNFHLEIRRAQQSAKALGHQLGFMAVPAAPYD